MVADGLKTLWRWKENEQCKDGRVIGLINYGLKISFVLGTVLEGSIFYIVVTDTFIYSTYFFWT